MIRNKIAEFFEKFNPVKDNFTVMRESYLREIPSEHKKTFYNYVTEMVRNYQMLEYIAQSFLKGGQKISKNINGILLLAVYEIFFLRVPHYVISDFVGLVKAKKEKGFVNFLLREMIRQTDGAIENLDMPESAIKSLSLKYSFPVDFTVELSKEFSKKKAEEIFAVLSKETPSVFMPNKFHAEMPSINTKEVLPDIFEIDNGEEYILHNQKGSILMFEKTSFLPIMLLNPKENEEILDMTAAPGNKSFMIYNKLNGKVNLTLNDINKERFLLMKDNVKKWNIDVKINNHDARKFPEDKKYDAVFIDAPCSNSGIISKKPDVKYKLTGNYLERLVKLQTEIVISSLKLLKDNGRLIYSVCSFLKEEIENVTEEVERSTPYRAVLEDIPFYLQKYAGEKYIRIIPDEENPIGFSMTVFKKK